MATVALVVPEEAGLVAVSEVVRACRTGVHSRWRRALSGRRRVPCRDSGNDDQSYQRTRLRRYMVGIRRLDGVCAGP